MRALFFRMPVRSILLVCGGILAWAIAAQGAARRDGSMPPSARELRAYENEWRAAVRDLDAGRPERAARRVAAFDPGDSLASLYRLSFLAGARLAAGDTVRADSLAAAALTGEIGPVWRHHFLGFRLRTFPATASDEATLVFLREVIAGALDNPLRAEGLHRALALDTSVVSRQERNEFLRRVTSAALADARLDSLYRRTAPDYPHGSGTWEEQRLMLDLEEKLGLWTEAVARAEAARPLARGTEDARFLQGRIALWLYNRGAFTESIRQYDVFRARYGDAPEALMQTARAHRRLGDHTRAQQWYSRLVERHPRDARTAEVLWMRAFDAEIEGRMDEALALYERIIRDFPGHVRAWEATFRLGLVRHKWGEPAKALEMFRGLREADAPGRLVGGARYWEGRLLMRSGDSNAARSAWEGLVRDYPFGFYGHAARRDWQAAGDFPDSLSWRFWMVRARRDVDASRQWLLDRVPGARAVPEGFGESRYLPPARLLSIGLDTLAMLTLRDRVSTDPNNSLLMFDAAILCREAGFDYEAYRFGLRLMDRLPLSVWADAPVHVLRLFYPPSYASLAEPEARRAGIPPALVLALIKQESGFDPLAVSRVGARGLMQLMPTTGAEQARKEGMQAFHVDSLFDPAVNIRLGVAYLRDVLRRDEGQYHYALAHYNAGPTALARWRPRLDGRPLEESVEDIGYAETREYVKRVMANYWTYQALWEGM